MEQGIRVRCTIQLLIGASMSEPHSSESNDDFVCVHACVRAVDILFTRNGLHHGEKLIVVLPTAEGRTSTMTWMVTIIFHHDAICL